MNLQDTAESYAPNLFILGAAKCGTTSLYELLKSHPEVFMSDIKEPGYFCEEFRKIATYENYLHLYKNSNIFPIRGEASHTYLTTPEAANKIHKHYPNAKFLLILRNPAERAHSLFWHMRKGRFESIKKFENALKIEDKRYYSLTFRNECPHYFYNYMYYRSGLYGNQLERYYSLYDTNQFHIITLNQLTNSFTKTMQGICQFLNINENYVFEQTLANEGKRFISRELQKIYFHNKYVYFLLGKTNLIRLNQLKIPELNEKTKKELMEQYAGDQELLYRLCGVKFT